MFGTSMQWGPWAVAEQAHSSIHSSILEQPRNKICLRTGWARTWRNHCKNVRDCILRVQSMGFENALKGEPDASNFSSNELRWCMLCYEKDLRQLVCA